MKFAVSEIYISKMYRKMSVLATQNHKQGEHRHSDIVSLLIVYKGYVYCYSIAMLCCEMCMSV